MIAVVKCAWCNGANLVDPTDIPYANTRRCCPDCGGHNVFVTVSTDSAEEGIVAQMIPTEFMQPDKNSPLTFVKKATDAELGREISNIIKRSKKK